MHLGGQLRQSWFVTLEGSGGGVPTNERIDPTPFGYELNQRRGGGGRIQERYIPRRDGGRVAVGGIVVR